MRNAEILADLADPPFQTELGQFNLELNVPPAADRAATGFADYEQELRGQPRPRPTSGRPSRDARHRPDRHPAHPDRRSTRCWTTSPPTRATGCSTSRSSAPAARTSSSTSAGVERLRTHTDSIAPEAACTSLQFHLQVAPDSFADYWNASQAIAGVQVAVGANSPFLFGRQLWAETRIALFEQATDTRPDELKAQGVRPRVWFGERWITSIFDLFEENVRYFPPLLPICDDEDPVEVLHGGGVPHLGELRLHNGTVYRWNRPVVRRHERPPAPAGGEPGAAGRPDRGRHAGQRRVLLRTGRASWPRRTGRSGRQLTVQRRRGELPRRRPTGHRRACCTGPDSARCRSPSWSSTRCCRRRPTGLDRFGVAPAEPGPPARRHRAALPYRPQRRGLADRDGVGRAAAPQPGPGRGAAPHAASRYAELQRTNEPVHTWPVD